MGVCQSDPRGKQINEPFQQQVEVQVQEEPKVEKKIVYDEESEQKAIKIQSFARGYKAKVEVDELKQQINKHQPPSEIAVPYDGPIQSKKEQVSKILDIKYNWPGRNDFKDLIRLKPYQFRATNAIYKGQWKEGKRHGRGIQIWEDGSIYQGDWVNDMADGKGRLIHPDGDYYQGDWVKDRAQGNGSFVHVDGNRYDGEWLEDKQHGMGSENQKEFIYNGQFQQGLKHGNGRIQWKNDNSSYQGDFFEGLLQGTGKFQFANGKVYSGQWYQSNMHGHGTLIYPDGKTYTGDFENGEKNGHGKMEYPDGKIFDGEWKNGKQHGPGKVTTSDGRSGQGVWENGKRVKEDLEIDRDLF